MTNNADLLERNLGRLVKRWADPLRPDQIERSCGDFVARIASTPEQGARRSSASALVAFAAILILSVTALWIGFSRDAARTVPRPSGHGQENPSPFPQRRDAQKEPASGAELTGVQSALCWLARHQNPDGGWSLATFSSRCTGVRCSEDGGHEYDVGVTGLTLLAFLGAGYSQLSKDELPDTAHPGTTFKFGSVVKKGLQRMLTQQAPDGCLGDRGMKYLYNHAIGTLCLVEAYGMTASPPLMEPAQRALNFLTAAQNPGKAWRYSPRCGDNDTSVMSWAMLAYHAAEEANLAFPRSVSEGMLAWLDEVTDRQAPFRVGYNARGTGKVYVPGKNDAFAHHDTMAAIGILSRIFLQKKKTDSMTASLQLIATDLPEWKPNQVDFYYWHYGALAFYQMEGPDGFAWKVWSEALHGALLPNQKKAADGCAAGSWTPEADRWGAEGGRIYVTAMGALCLETYYRYAQVLGGKK